MNKKKILTAAAVFLSLLIAIGGWYLTSVLIETKSNTLLSSSGFLEFESPVTTPSASEQPDLQANKPLPYLEMINVIENWESSGWERFHEPIENQITMASAIQIAKSFVRDMKKCDIMSETKINFNNIKTIAYLCQNQPYENFDLTLSPIYSYWLVSLSNNNMKIHCTINAVTGQVWKIEITPVMSMEYSEGGIRECLDLFVSKLGLESGGKQKMSASLEAETIFVELYDYKKQNEDTEDISEKIIKHDDQASSESDLYNNNQISSESGVAHKDQAVSASSGDSNYYTQMTAVSSYTRTATASKSLKYRIQIYLSLSNI